MNYDFSKKINVEDLNSLYITGANHTRYEFKGISNQSPMGWTEVVWGANLTRSRSFALENIDKIDIGYVRQVEIKFPILNVEDFIVLQQMLHEKYLIVDAFYVDDMKRHTCEMAITNNERKKIYSFGTSILGMRDISVKFVATNRDSEERYLTLIANNGTDQLRVAKYPVGNSVSLSDGGEFNKPSPNLSIIGWNTRKDGNGESYEVGQISLTDDLTLYAVWGE